MATMQKTTEECHQASQMLTHDSLINLGKQIANKEDREKREIARREKIVNSLLKISLNDNAEWDAVVAKKAIKLFQQYVELSEQIQVKLARELSVAEEDVEALNDEMTGLVKECDTKDNELEIQKKYWGNRCENLRNKCIARNSTIRLLKVFLCASYTAAAFIAFNGYDETMLMVYSFTVITAEFIKNSALWLFSLLSQFIASL
jgi:hypothetical protein